MQRRVFLASVMLTPLALSLGGCGDQFPDYNYKITVYVGDKAFSSVRRVTQKQGFSAADSSGQAVKRAVQGQAVIIDIPGRSTIYALLSKPAEPEYAQKVAGYALLSHVPAFERDPKTDTLAVERGTESLDRMAAAQRAMVKIVGPVELPRNRPNSDSYRGPRSIDNWPMFVTFDNPTDPKTVRDLSPDSIGISRITIEIVDDGPTKGLEAKLPWLPEYYNKNFSGSRFQSLDDVNAYGLSALITSGLFSTGNGLS